MHDEEVHTNYLIVSVSRFAFLSSFPLLALYVHEAYHKSIKLGSGFAHCLVVFEFVMTYAFLYAAAGIDITSTHSLQFDYKTIETATDKFSESNKIGRRGFGEVFQGIVS